MRARHLLLGLVVSLGASAAAQAINVTPAGDLWDWSYSAPGVTAAGTLTTTDTLVDGAYTITGITGTRNGDAITGLLPAGWNPAEVAGWYLVSDNLLFPGNPSVDVDGFTYSTASSGDFNVCSNGPGCGSATGFSEISGNTLATADLSFTVVSAVSEPATTGLLGLGLAGLLWVGLGRRRLTPAKPSI